MVNTPKSGSLFALHMHACTHTRTRAHARTHTHTLIYRYKFADTDCMHLFCSQPCDMARPHAIRMLMFCTSLFDKLPRFLVKPTQSAIELNGSLGERVKGTVQLKNPSSRSVQYKLLLVGKDSSPFALEVTEITVSSWSG